MVDQEKVIKGLEHCVMFEDHECIDYRCPYYYKDCSGLGASLELLKDALALLKAQEPVMVEERADTDTINCPKCGQQFARVGRDKSIYLDTDEEPNYCPKCGQAVKWE